eukprot:410217_1
MNIENLQNNQLILYIPYLLCKKKNKKIKLSNTRKSIAELSSVKFLKKITGEGITFMRHYSHRIDEEIKVSIFGKKCKMLQIGNGSTPTYKAPFKIGKVVKALKRNHLKNIPSDCCGAINQWALSSVNQNRSEIEQFVKVINECNNRDFMHISNLFQLCLSPFFECL